MPQPFPTMLLVLPSLVLVFALLPVKLEGRKLLSVAFSLWCLGGLFMCVRGVQWLNSIPNPDMVMTLVAGVVALGLGFAKARTVLRKAALANIDRLHQLAEPAKLLAVYPMRSWMMLVLMIGLGASLTLFNAPVFLRGMVNLAVGMALLGSSLYYWQAMNQVSQESIN
ncbi:MAG: hypothetical protein ACKO34_02360 [Vampirovibrionales bacterium]